MEKQEVREIVGLVKFNHLFPSLNDYLLLWDDIIEDGINVREENEVHINILSSVRDH
ncbi:MAG: hypothetical protein ACRD5B_15515 [Nitrososphaeraceae archaeon]